MRAIVGTLVSHTVASALAESHPYSHLLGRDSATIYIIYNQLTTSVFASFFNVYTRTIIPDVESTAIIAGDVRVVVVFVGKGNVGLFD